MTSRSNILLITKEDSTVDMVKSALSKSQNMTLADICQEVSEMRVYLANGAPQAVVADIDPNPSRILYNVGNIIAMYPEMRFVVISSQFNNELILQAMQAGARHFLRKESIEFELVTVLQRLIAGTSKNGAESGSVISVFSASGGCGATTVALNLANELRLASSKPVLTIDLDTCYGTVSTYLGLTGQYGIADVLTHKGPIDKHLVRSSACSYMGDFHVLISPASVASPRARSLRYENLLAVLESCRQVYGYTVIDAPRVDESVAKNLASVSDLVLVVFQLTVKDIKFARALILSLTKSRIAPEKIIPLANRVKRRGPLVRLEDGEKVLGLNCLHPIRSDWRNAIKSVNRGQPLAEVAPRSRLRRDFIKLAARIDAHRTNGNGKV